MARVGGDNNGRDGDKGSEVMAVVGVLGQFWI